MVATSIERINRSKDACYNNIYVLCQLRREYY